MPKKTTKKTTKKTPKTIIEKEIVQELKKEREERKAQKCNNHGCHQSSGTFYGLGFIGAAIYYISTATGFWMGVLGLLKALVWPTFLVLELLKFLKV